MKDKSQLQIAKNVVRDIFREYRQNEEIIKNEVSQSMTSNYSNVVVKGGYHDGQNVPNQIMNKAQAQTFCESVESILKALPSTYKKIIINRYIRRYSHNEIIGKMNIDDDFYIAERTYYDWYDNAVMAFYNESVARMIEMKTGI